jgi:hypothetical protein
MATRTVPCRKERSAGNQKPDLIRMATRDLDRMMGLDIAAIPVVPAWLAVGLDTAAVPVVPAVSAACSLAQCDVGRDVGDVSTVPRVLSHLGLVPRTGQNA